MSGESTRLWAETWYKAVGRDRVPGCRRRQGTRLWLWMETGNQDVGRDRVLGWSVTSLSMREYRAVIM